MQLPLFPLNVVLFPGMVLPLYIFEPRYREMIGRCLEEKSPFGVALIREGSEVGEAAVPYKVGTAARILRTQNESDGRMRITVVGTQRFRIEQLDTSHSYLSATVVPLPVTGGGTKLAAELMQRLRPKITDYVDVLARASNQQISLDRLPQDPKTLAFLVAIALQINNDEKQALLELPGVPEMLARENALLAREVLLLRHMADTQADLGGMSMGPTGYIFPN